MTVMQDTTAKQVMAWYKGHRGPVCYQTTQKARHHIIGDHTAEQTCQCMLLPSYASQLLKADPNATVKLKWCNNRFSSLCVAPIFSQNAWVQELSLTNMISIMIVDSGKGMEQKSVGKSKENHG
jgi:hypothetical protein